MKLYLPAATAATAAALTPTMVKGYGLGGRMARRPMQIVTTPSGTVCTPGALLREQLREQQAMVNQAFRHSSPRYEITDNHEKFEIAVDLPGVKASDVNVSIENDGQVLTLKGHRETKKEGYAYASKFSQSFTLDPAVDADKFTANLQNGVLVVSAPKDWKRIEDAVKTIPITEFAHETIASAEEHLEQTAEADKQLEGGSDDMQTAEEEIVVENVNEPVKVETVEPDEA